jgi:3-oxoacyl-[acyl-carrier-protein] synthase II
MSRRVVITGLGTVCGHGVGVEALWLGACEGRSAVGRIGSFDPSGFRSRIASEIKDFKISQYVPKSYRKATKVMARDIELAVAAADQAVRDAGLMTPGIDAEQPRSYPGPRNGAHIGAGLIAAELNELVEALATSRDGKGAFDIHHWGREGIQHLTPLWLLKYLPNMLACHVTIVHDAQGPSNTITCGEASSGLSIGESMRVIQRGAADVCFSGGAESKVNPMAFYRQQLTGRLVESDGQDAGRAVRPFDRGASGTALGEGGGIIILEALDTAEPRGAKIYAELVGFGASHTVYPQAHGFDPDPAGRGIASAIRAAMRDAEITPGDVELIVPSGCAIPAWDRAEAAALRTVFGQRLPGVPIVSVKPLVGNCGAGAGAIDVAVAARALATQTIPARVNCDDPIDAALNCRTAPSAAAPLRHALVFTTSLGGQNVALVLRKV